MGVANGVGKDSGGFTLKGDSTWQAQPVREVMCWFNEAIKAFTSTHNKR